MKVLTVARWYPSHDSPGRGSFVSDLVEATVNAGVDARVASFDRVLVHGRSPQQCERLHARARAAYDAVSSPEALFTVPRSLGAPGVPVARLPLVQLPGVPDAAALIEDHLDALRPFVRDLVSRWRPDLIHAHTGLPDGIAAAAVGREHGIPVVVSEHASTIEDIVADPVALERYRTLCEPGVRLLCVSPSLATRLASLLGAEPNRIGVLPNPVAVGEFPLGEGVDRDPDQLLWVGSLGQHKHHDVLLRAFAQLRAQRPRLRLRLVGTERKVGDRARLAALARELLVADEVQLDDFLDRKGVADAMRRAAVFVHPSPSETFGIVAAEAILTGLPVATRRSGGVPWIVERSGGFGAVAEDDGAGSFAAAIEAVLVGVLPVDAPAARSRLAEEFSADVVARQALAHYAAVIDSTRAATHVPPTVPSTRNRTTVASTPYRSAPPTVLAAKGRDQARRLVPDLPSEMRRDLVLVVPRAVDGAPADCLGELGVRLVEADLAGPRTPQRQGRLARLARSAGLRRKTRKPPMENTLFTAAIRRAADTVRHNDAVVDVVAVDAPAAALIANLDATRVRLAPGTLRWLADCWDAQPPGSTHPQTAGSASDPG